MKRRFRQKQDIKPKEDPEPNNGTSDDAARENVDIDDIIREIDTQLEEPRIAPADKNTNS
jgi:hypothetical protein